VPQVPPQPLSPHWRPVHCGTHWSQRAPVKPTAHEQAPAVQVPCAPQSTPSHEGVSVLEPQAARSAAQARVRAARVLFMGFSGRAPRA
jgi:hypothetical protein